MLEIFPLKLGRLINFSAKKINLYNHTTTLMCWVFVASWRRFLLKVWNVQPSSSTPLSLLCLLEASLDCHSSASVWRTFHHHTALSKGKLKRCTLKYMYMYRYMYIYFYDVHILFGFKGGESVAQKYSPISVGLITWLEVEILLDISIFKLKGFKECIDGLNIHIRELKICKKQIDLFHAI